MTGLRQKVVSGFGWRAFAEISSIVLQIAFTAILARLLSLADFGLAAMCLLFIRFVRALTEVGFGAAVIQSQEITPQQVSAIFCIQLAVKCGIFALCVVGAPLAAGFFEQASLTNLIHVVAFVVIIDGLSFPITIARKNLKFRGFSILQLSGLILGNIAGIVMALTDFGVWSLIVRLLVEHSVVALLVWPIVGWWPVRPEFRGIVPFLRFGVTMFASTAVYFFSQNIAAIIIGKYIGVDILGLYNVAYNLAIVPAQKIQSILTTVLTPAFSIRQHEPKKMRSAVFQSWFSVGAVFIPLMIGLAAVGPIFVPLIYGAKWHLAGQLLTILSFVGLLKGFEHLFRSILIATGRPKIILFITLIETAISVPFLFAAGQYFGIWGILIAYLSTGIFAFLLTARSVQNAIGGPELLAIAIARSLLAGGLMFVIVYSIPFIVEANLAVLLILEIFVGASFYVVFRSFILSTEERKIVKQWPIIGKYLHK